MTSNTIYKKFEINNIASDMKFQIQDLGNSTQFTIGTISNNYWTGRCQAYERTTSFKATNIYKIQEVKLTKVGFDDYMQIKFNGHVVYVGPDGGDRLELKLQLEKHFETTIGVPRVYNGVNYHSCERGTDWEREVNIDLKPYLIEGTNAIDMRVIVSGMGGGWMQIKASEINCDEFTCVVTGLDHSPLTETE
jgi:hypothetical protein